MNPTIIKLAASTMLVGAAVSGVSPSADEAFSSGVSEADTVAARNAARAADAARAALARNDAAAAIGDAERAVEYMPNSAEYRHLLGRAYLAAGRFASAETSFQDALTINPDLDRTAFNLALAQIAQGDRADALEELNALEGRIGASDLGLAMALAGNHDRAITILRQAAQAEGGNARARQNLALTYAMAGRWAESRITAAQDVSAAEVNQRMQEWATFAAPERSSDQVASMLGVRTNEADPGQPVRLALNAAPSPVMTADAGEGGSAVVAFTTPAEDEFAIADEIETIAADTVPMRVAGDYAEPGSGAFVVEDEGGDEWVAADEAVAAAAPVPATAPARVDTSVVRTAAALPTPQATSAGRYVVQIGAFTEEANVTVAWNRAVGRHSQLAQYEPRRTVFQHGRTYYRLSFGGFDNWNEASGLCRSLKSQGQPCFVRERTDGPAAVQTASVVRSDTGGDGWFDGHVRTEVASRETNRGWFA